MHGPAGILSSGLSKRRSESVYRTVKRAILLRERRPGDALLEQDLAFAMNCSQGTVREALMRLEQDGLVARRGYRGTVVSATSVEEAALLAGLRIEIEMQAARRALTVAKPGDFGALDGIVAAMRAREAEGDDYAVSELDNSFHATILQIARLEGLRPILTRCMLHLHRHTVGNPDLPDGSRRGEAADAHAALAETLRAGDAAEVSAAAREHIEGVVRRWSPDVWKALKAS